MYVCCMSGNQVRWLLLKFESGLGMRLTVYSYFDFNPLVVGVLGRGRVRTGSCWFRRRRSKVVFDLGVGVPTRHVNRFLNIGHRWVTHVSRVWWGLCTLLSKSFVQFFEFLCNPLSDPSVCVQTKGSNWCKPTSGASKCKIVQHVL